MSTNVKDLPKTHWKKLYNPNYLGAWSINPGEDLILTIKTVSLESVTGSDGKSEECTVIRWVEDQKPMILNKTNAKTISDIITSPYIEDWPGRKVALYATKVKAFGDMVDALRVRPKAPKVEKEKLSPDHPKWAKAMAAIHAGNTSIAAIRKRYELSDQDEKLLSNAEVA